VASRPLMAPVNGRRTWGRGNGGEGERTAVSGAGEAEGVGSGTRRLSRASVAAREAAAQPGKDEGRLRVGPACKREGESG
jgi:hypothetical protein